MDKENIVEDSIRNNENKLIKISTKNSENGMSKCNSYNEENNNGFDSKLIVIKSNVKIVENVGENVMENVMENVVSRCGGESMYTTPPALNNSSHTPATHSQHHKSTLPQQNKFCHNSCYGAQGGLVVIINFNLCFIMINFNDAVAALRKSGAKSETVTIMNVTVKDCDKWTRIALTLDKEVMGYVADADGEYRKGTTRVVFISLYSIVGTLKNTDDTRAIASYVIDHPTALQILLSSAKGELLQEEIAANATYTNHFTGEEVENESDHNSIFNHLVSVALSDKGLRAVEKIEDKLLGF